MKELSRCLLVLGVCLSFCYAVPSSFQNMKSGKSYENLSMVQVSDSPLHILTADACLLTDSSLQFILQGYLHSPTNDMKNFTQVFPDHEGNLFYYQPSTMKIKPLYITLKQLLSQKYVAVPELPNLLIQARRRYASNQFQSFQQNLVLEDTLNIEDELDISIVRESDLYVIWQFKVLNISSKYDRYQTSSTDDYIPKYEKMEEIAKLYSMDTLYLEFTAVFILALMCGICIGKKYSCSRSKALVKPIIVSLGANEYLISSETKSNQGDSVSKLPIKIEDSPSVTKNDYILFNFMDTSNLQTSNIERKSTTDSEQKSSEDVSPNAFPHHPISIATSSPSQQVKYEVNPIIQEFDINSSESDSNSEYEQDLAEEPESDDEYSEYDEKASDSDSASAVSFKISNLDLKGLHLQETNEDFIQFQKSDSADISRSDGDLSSLPNKRISSSFIYIEADKPEISLKRSFGGEYMAKMTETKPKANIEIFIRSNLEVKYNGERKDSTDDSDCKEDIDKLTYFLENGRLNKTFDKLSFLGKGGFGRVYKAKHKLDEQIYAVKVVPFNYGVRKSVKQHKLFREVISMSKLNSKYLLRYYNCWLESSNNLKQTPEVENSSDEERSVDESIDSSLSVGEPYIPLLLHIQTEYSPGKTLKHWLENKYRVVDRYENLIIFKQLAKGLLHIHKNNLIHRDLKPANIFIETDNRMIKVKIGDFGLAILHNYESDSILPNIEFGNGRIPRSHSLNVGTPLYFPPEQKKNPNYNHKVDIYPLGLILLELSTNLVTTHEKIATFTELRVNNRLADDFEERFPIESRLIKWLVCEDPNLRPDSLEILESIPVMKWEKEMNESSPWSGRYIPSSPVIL